MGFIKSVLALIGLAALVVAGYGFYKVDQISQNFDPEAGRVYLEMAEKLVETRNSAEATIWKIPVEDDISAEDVEEAMKFVANELNIANVGELPLSLDVEAKTGQPYRFVKIFMFCNSLTAAQMMDYSDAYSAYLPCRITLIEDKTGKLWLISLNMDLMIYGGEPLPPELKAEAMKVKEIIIEIMNRGAAGEF